MKRLVLAAVALVALAAPLAANAHPLGNFTINRYSELDVSGNRLYVVYVLDLAEIPTFQARGTTAAAYVRTISRNVHLAVNGKPAALVPVRHELAYPPGQGGLDTTRLEVLFAGPTLSGRPTLGYHDGNYAGRLGWKEIVVRAGDGGSVARSSAPNHSISDGLLAYPKNLLQSPLDVTSATAAVAPGAAAGPVPALLTRTQLAQRVGVRAVADSGFAKLILHRPSGWFLVAALAIAFFWGAAHALSPGHGKSIITAYLVGSRGTARHAFLLGGTVTITHTIGVFALGLVTLSLSQFILPEQLYPWLNLISALLIVGVGVSVLRWRMREWRRPAGHHHHDHDHGHGHDHHHGHDDPALSTRRLLGLGISGGIIPCPTALVVLLAAISLHRVGYGLVLIVAFSLGLAATMTGLGLAAVAARGAFSRVDMGGRAIRILPALSAVVVLALGLAMTARALPHVT
jgi:ABC-type nickel/cobalt efflux system permease component RcnA